jgi:hypothetical protein
MKLSVSMSRPLSAMIVLAACSGLDTTNVALPANTTNVALPANTTNVALPANTTNVALPDRTTHAVLPDHRVVEPSPAVEVNEARLAASTADTATSDSAADLDATSRDAAPVVVDAESPNAVDAGALLPLGACLACAQARCPVQFDNAIGAASGAENLADVTQLLDCVIGDDWELGNAIPNSSCFFADPAQPLGSLIPCYCGSTPLAQCLATGPLDHAEACGLEVEIASGCDPVVASCVTTSGSNPEVALGDTLQLLNCERAACPVDCGFPPPIEE